MIDLARGSVRVVIEIESFRSVSTEQRQICASGGEVVVWTT